MANSPRSTPSSFESVTLICAAPAGIVREILPRLPATRIPGVAEAVEGLVNVRGSLLTVLDGHVLLDQERRADDEGAIVVLEVGRRRYGLGVGQVLDFLEVPAALGRRPGAAPRRRPAPGEGGGLCATTSTSSCSTSTRCSRRSSEARRDNSRPPPVRRQLVNHTVLVCDDAIFMRTMISDILSQAGFEVVGEAESGLQAVEKYRQLKPDLVTMDIVMPDMGGIEAVREICKTDPDAKILMCSAMGQQALVVEAIQAGAKDFVVKPFQPSRVLEAVQRVLG